MAQSDEKIQKLLSDLPKAYQAAIKSLDVEKKINEIGEEYNLDESQEIYLDREVTYLVLRLSDAPDFITRIEDRLGISGEKAAGITNAVTDKILQPIQNRLEASEAKADIPVPQPPSEGNTPTPSYGGDTDPYREPPE